MTRTRDQETFEALAEQNRAEIQLHCYRMLDSYHDAEDVIQETLAGYVRVVFAYRAAGPKVDGTPQGAPPSAEHKTSGDDERPLAVAGTIRRSHMFA